MGQGIYDFDKKRVDNALYPPPCKLGDKPVFSLVTLYINNACVIIHNVSIKSFECTGIESLFKQKCIHYWCYCALNAAIK